MGFKNFRINCTLRILLLGAVITAFVYLIFNTRLYAVHLLGGILMIYQIYSLIRYVDKTNRDLVRFVQSIRYEDFSETFSSGGRGATFQELSDAFTDVTQQIRNARSEREEHYQYLQTVVQHVGIGVLSFQQDGEVELINKSAKRILGVSQLKNIRSLESLGDRFVDTLIGMHSGDRSLMKIEVKGKLLQLAVNAVEFRMRNRKFTLVSLQDIQNELERERLTKELEIAHQVQMKLLPKESPKHPGVDIAGICIPAKEVGGDYYDYVDFGNGKLGIVVGDVSGKGIPASIYMTLTKGVLQSHAVESHSPKDVLAKINTMIYNSIDRRAFVSMFYAIFDRKASKLVCSRAGHDPAIHYHGERGECSFIHPSGIALGLERGEIFRDVIEDMEIPFKKGDFFVFYTDGFTEAMNRERAAYGEKRLLKIIQENGQRKAGELIDAVCRDVQVFTEGYPQYDDMTMVTLRIN